MNLLRSVLSVLLASVTLGFGSIDFLEQKYYEEESFTRISEYFDGVEVSGNRIIIRSDSDHRTGHYVTFQLSGNHSIDHFKLEVYEFGAKEPKDYLFKADTPIAAKQPIFLGLTGGIWGEKLKPPVAYKLSVIGTGGNTIESATSFLWGDD
ncbi:MAG: hypothetical protein O3C43_16655 [Verrucomicrobia bacterium]|nr:hypothetical protein [Verrucomicrobiota bacterium]MDA1068120.1 hypothetical protein [Verrucomicrobiota bacterium]